MPSRPKRYIWRSPRQLKRQYFKSLLDEAKFRQVFDKGYFENAKSELRKVESVRSKASLLNIALLIFLVVGPLSPDASLNIFGFQPKNADKIKEVLFFVAVIVGLYAAALGGKARFLTDIIEVHLKRDYPLQAYPFLRPLFFEVSTMPSLYDFPRDINVRFSLGHKLLFGTLALLAIPFILSIIVLQFSIQIYLLIDIFQSPALPYYISRFFAVLALLTVLLELGIIILELLPLPFVDERFFVRLGRLKAKAPDDFEQQIKRYPLSRSLFARSSRRKKLRGKFIRWAFTRDKNE